MAILLREQGHSRIALASHGLVGRSSACSVRLDEPRASSEHARLQWKDGAWTVRDLGSRNGTFVNGERLAAGSTRALSAGDVLAFGGAEKAICKLVDASPPVAMARRLPGDDLLGAREGMLAIPSADDPRACVFEVPGGEWVVEIEGQSRPVRDGDVLSIAGEAWMLHLPILVNSTVEARDGEGSVEDIELRFRVSRDEEHVEVTVLEGGGRARVIPPKAHHYTWLTIARARIRDEADPALIESQRGWIFVDDLCRMLSTDENKLNVEIYRIRQDLAALGVVNAPVAIERRRGSRQLRAGTARIAISPMD